MSTSSENGATLTARERESAVTVPVYGQYSIDAKSGEGCHIVCGDGRRVLDFYGGHAVASLGYGHPVLTRAIAAQAETLLFQSNAVALEIRAEAAERLIAIAPDGLGRVFFVNSGAEANENALRVACRTSNRTRILAITHGFHGRTAAAAAVTWKASESWYGFPNTPFAVDFIPRNEVDAARRMIDSTVAAVIFEPVQGVAGAFDLSAEFVTALRQATLECGAALIADEVQCGMGRSGSFFACQDYGIEPDMLTIAKSLGGGIPCAALLVGDEISSNLRPGDLGSTFGGCPVAAAAIVAVVSTIETENLLANVRAREAEIRDRCIVGPVSSVQGKGLLLGLCCDGPARDVQAILLANDILTGTSADPNVLRLLPPLILESQHVHRLAEVLGRVAPP